MNIDLILLHCHHFSSICSNLLTSVNDYTLVKILLFGDQNYNQKENSYIINTTIKYLVDSGTWRSNSVVSYDLNALNVFMIPCF